VGRRLPIVARYLWVYYKKFSLLNRGCLKMFN
jgi:hypothetical protein